MIKDSFLYLDHNATTPLCDEAILEMEKINREFWANPSSSHKLGKKAKEMLENYRETIARLLKVRPDEIIFTSGGTESNNLALKGLISLRPSEKDHIITTQIEHSAVYNPVQFLESKGFIKVTYIKPDKTGIIDPEDIERSITERTFLVSVIMANNEIGTIQDTKKIGKICERYGIIFHTDAVQALGKIEIDINRDNISLLSASAHKFNGPKGTGFLFKRRGILLDPLIDGGKQERGLRSGTEALALVAGMTVSLEKKLFNMKKDSDYLKELTEKFFKKLKENIPYVELNGNFEKRVPNTLNIRFPGISGPKIVSFLDEENIFVSPSSACHSSSSKPSRILKSLGLMADEAFSSVRFSFSPEITEKDIEKIISVLKKTVVS